MLISYVTIGVSFDARDNDRLVLSKARVDLSWAPLDVSCCKLPEAVASYILC
jgi:hypothetical protein